MSTSISFPSNPTVGQVYSYSGVSYVYNGKQWQGNYQIPTSGSTVVFPRVNVDNTSNYIDTDGGGNLIFVDPVTGSKTLAQLAAGGGSAPSQYTLTCAPTTNIDFSVADNFYLLINQNTVFSVSNASTNVGKNGTIVIQQDGVGGRTFTEATEFKTPINGAVISQTTTANSVSIITYYITSSTSILINYLGGFA